MPLYLPLNTNSHKAANHYLNHDKNTLRNSGPYHRLHHPNCILPRRYKDKYTHYYYSSYSPHRATPSLPHRPPAGPKEVGQSPGYGHSTCVAPELYWPTPQWPLQVFGRVHTIPVVLAFAPIHLVLGPAMCWTVPQSKLGALGL